ncbi:BT1A1 protein, partial [Bucorvus abyssinicus]|nr:BT1A1 protein [Bucorvus abyssinicus]
KVTLDPDTANPELVISADGRTLRWSETSQNLPETPQRFTMWSCALAREGFESGRHCWEVLVEGMVGAKSGWAVGVAMENIKKESPIDFIPENGVWGLGYNIGQLMALTFSRTPLALPALPRRVWVCLDYEQGLVTFLSGDTGHEIFTFPPASFNGRRLRP